VDVNRYGQSSQSSQSSRREYLTFVSESPLDYQLVVHDL
ncbi:unnamed protein product, partial [Acidithrix sp. C25]